MMDINERASVQPYGKEGEVFSSPNCYLSETQGFSLLPAPVSEAKHLHYPSNPENTLSGAKRYL